MKFKLIGQEKLRTKKITLGHGKPVVTIVSGIHGDEKVGPTVLRLLVQRLKKINLKGTLKIIPVANIRAFRQKVRFISGDGGDLNRAFAKNRGGQKITPITRLAKIIRRECAGAELVIDIHTLVRQSTIGLGLQFSEGQLATRRKAGRLIKASGVKAVWKVDPIKESWIKGSLVQSCLERGIPAFGLELADRRKLTEDKIESEVDLLVGVLKAAGLIEGGQPVLSGPIPIFQRCQVRANKPGIFIPKRCVGTLTKRKEVVGLFNGDEVRSPRGGILLICRQRGRVTEKEPLFTVGVKIGAL